MAEISGGEYIAAALRAEGMDTAFGIVDGTYLGFLSGLKKHNFRIVGPRHETSAAHMAGAYARLTGRPGLCFASNGPGVANILPGLTVEEAEGNRVFVVTSSRRTGITYPDRGGTYQYFDQVGVIGALSKWSASAQSFERIPELFRSAMRELYRGRPGVVHLDVPENLMNGKHDFPKPWKPGDYRSLVPASPDPDSLEKAAGLLANARLPLIHAGSGIIHAGAYAELQRLAELLAAPVTTSWAARGVLDERYPLAFPMVHVELYHKLRKDADAILILGSRIGETDWWGKEPYWRAPQKQSSIQVDIDERSLGRNKPAELLIKADVKVFLQRMCEILESKKKKIPIKKRRAL
ncbi:MAG: thiamine pyrophosphate-binding protein, partial [Bacteroidetes bacterium]